MSEVAPYNSYFLKYEYNVLFCTIEGARQGERAVGFLASNLAGTTIIGDTVGSLPVST